ncbi:MAG: sugar ABC transporter permease [Streptococcaceae bacterium]|jgi:arabinogalactan oligomer/maltooligosaccharide transport system permease protein|nr:sugar ABC transporter permease [Streptococcaceae bacterium]
MKSYKTQQRVSLVFRYILLVALAIIWIAPVVWIVLTSFSTNNNTGFVQTLVPINFTLENYTGLFQNELYPYLNWVWNTFILAVVCAVCNTFITTIMSYALSRLRFKMRKPFMQFALIIGMFPGIMGMIAMYAILNALNMLNLFGMALIYVGGSALGFYIFKGFLDTIPASIDEAAMIDGATKWEVFRYITLPLCKPMIIYTSLTAFTGPWLDFLLSSYILGGQSPKIRTVAYGLQNMLTNSRGASAQNLYQFIAGSVLIAVPITILFIFMQKFYVNGITAGADKG